MNILKNEKGFTLIELVLIIVILGVLAAVAFIQFGNITTDAKDATLQAAFSAATAQLAIGINAAKGLPGAATSGVGSFGLEVYDKLSFSSSGLSKNGILCVGTDCTFDLRTNACVAGVDRKITVTYNGPTHATTPGRLAVTTGPTGC